MEEINSGLETDKKINKYFSGRVVRKDLTKKMKVGNNVPIYVLEYLLGSNCATDEEDLIVDRCPSCKGFWLDRGELDRIVQAASREHAELAKEATMVQRPQDWSLLKWWAHNLKSCYLK